MSISTLTAQPQQNAALNMFKLSGSLPTPAPSSTCGSAFDTALVSRPDDSDARSQSTVVSTITPFSPTSSHHSGTDTPPTSVLDASTSASPTSKSIDAPAVVSKISTSPSPFFQGPKDIRIPLIVIDESDQDAEIDDSEHTVTPRSEPTGPISPPGEDNEKSQKRRRSTRLRDSISTVKSYNIHILDGTARRRRRKSEAVSDKTTSPSSDNVPTPSSNATLISSPDSQAQAQRSSSTLLTPLQSSKPETRSSRRVTLAVMEDLGAEKEEPPSRRSRKRRSLATEPTAVATEDEPVTSKKRRVSKRLSLRAESATKPAELELPKELLKEPPAVPALAPEPSPQSADGEAGPGDTSTGHSDKVLDPTLPKPPTRPIQKKWQECGLYAGQTRLHEPDFEGARRGHPKPLSSPPKERKFLPLPVFLGERLIRQGRDYRLPFDVMNLLPEEVKPTDGWTLKRDGFPRSRYIGDAIREKPRIDKDQAFCACSLPTGCDDRCWNLCMKIECDDTNCNMPLEKCENRVFTTKMSAAPGKRLNQFHIGLEVMRTPFKGFGVRAVRNFNPGEPIAEYTGDIITSTEAHRRQTEDYAKMNNFYMMTLRRGLIVDATKRGSITRFVNHSCNPNCTMDLRVVNGVERVALFAGDGGIRTGEEITYDYDFSPFDGTAHAQKCYCGEPTCRGFIEKRAAARAKTGASAQAKKDKEVQQQQANAKAAPPVVNTDAGSNKAQAKTKSKSEATSVIMETMSRFMPVTHEKRRAKFGIHSKPKRRKTGEAPAGQESKDVPGSEPQGRTGKGSEPTPEPNGSSVLSAPVPVRAQNRQTPCDACGDPRNRRANLVVFCDGCPRAFHQRCHDPIVTSDELADDAADWFCGECRKRPTDQGLEVAASVPATIHAPVGSGVTIKATPSKSRGKGSAGVVTPGSKPNGVVKRVVAKSHRLVGAAKARVSRGVAAAAAAVAGRPTRLSAS